LIFRSQEEEMITHRRIMAVILVSMALLPSRSLFSQASSPQATTSQQDQAGLDKDVELLRKDVRSQKKQIVAANLNLTDKEAEQFWPVYEQYTDELMKINNKKYAAIKQYAQNYDTMTDDQAQDLMKQALEVDQSVAELRLKYIPIFRKVVSGRKTAQYLQIERRLVMVIDLQLASGIPLVEP
jgi:Spy/CpxP family protein refolding chaperone